MLDAHCTVHSKLQLMSFLDGFQSIVNALHTFLKTQIYCESLQETYMTKNDEKDVNLSSSCIVYVSDFTVHGGLRQPCYSQHGHK